MARKKRKPRKKPMRVPLSALDKFVYVLTFVIGCVMSVAVVAVYAIIGDKIALADASAVAVRRTDVSMLVLPLCFFFLIISIFPIYLYSDKEQPIFGNKSFKPRPGQLYAEETPIVSRKFWREMSDETKNKLAKFLVVTLVVFVAFFALALFGIYPRNVLDKEENIKTYNSLNEMTDIYDTKEADKLIIDIRVDSTKNSRSYSIEIIFVFGENKYGFTEGSFYGMKNEQALEYMLRTKADFAGKYEVQSTNLMEKLCKYRNFTEAEKALVYELFDYAE